MMDLGMIFFLFALFILFTGGVLSVLAPFRQHVMQRGAWPVIASGLLGITAVIHSMASPRPIFFQCGLSLPLASFAVQIDGLSAFFLLVIFLVSPLIAIFGNGYVQHYPRERQGLFWLFFNLLVLGMALVVTAFNGVLFIMAWEVMSFAAFLLVTFEDKKEEVRTAGYIYLIAAHIGVVLIFILFWLLSVHSNGGMDFISFASVSAQSPMIKNTLFILAVLGFGAKAGFVPMHVWLPEAHPAAPGPVSALMSGVMIKTGFYGILRILTFLGPPPSWWGGCLILIGLTSGLFGVLFAIVQHDLKRLLAYHSIENIGIIAIGLGLGLVGVSYHMPALAVLGFAGGLVHILNHALFKSLLFMGAGSIMKQTRTMNIEYMGGLIRRMPVTAISFMIGAAAISGLPFLNGFISEFLIYMASFKGLLNLDASARVLSLMSIVGLAAIGALAVMCFTKVTGIVFLGEPRSPVMKTVMESGSAMKIPMIVLTSLCALAGSAPFVVIPLVEPVLVSLGLSRTAQSELSHLLSTLTSVLLSMAAFITLFFLVMVLRRKKNKRLAGKNTVTWDCGYTAPDARMQYTASSFVQPLTDEGAWLFKTHQNINLPLGYFPKKGLFSSHTDDILLKKLFQPVFSRISWIFGRLQWMQHGRISLYILYIAVALLGLLLWFGGIR